MANKKISDFTTLASPQASDYLLVSSGGTTYKTQASSISVIPNTNGVVTFASESQYVDGNVSVYVKYGIVTVIVRIKGISASNNGLEIGTVIPDAYEQYRPQYITLIGTRQMTGANSYLMSMVLRANGTGVVAINGAQSTNGDGFMFTYPYRY